jgi:hypothetical protein
LKTYSKIMDKYGRKYKKLGKDLLSWKEREGLCNKDLIWGKQSDRM